MRALRSRSVPLLVVLLSTAVCGQSQTDRASPAPAPKPGASAVPAARDVVALPSIAPLVRRVRGAVVNVEVVATSDAATGGSGGPDELFERFFGGPEGFGGLGIPQPDPRQGIGSGFLIDPTGWIVTNNHVVEGATAIRITLDDGRTFGAEVKGRDPLTDVALLQLKGNPKNLPSVPFGDSDALQIGDWLTAIGNPFGLSSSVSTGILSARARDIQMGPYDDFLQTDAAINPGNSGGPLFNLKGEVVGMNTAIVGGGAGIGFALPSNMIRALLPQLREKGVVTRAWLGAYVQDLTPQLAKALRVPATQGAIVTQLEPNSPAQRAGLKPDDVITQLDGEPIPSASALTRNVALKRPGNDAQITLYRGGQERKERVRLGTRPDLEGLAQTPAPEKDQAPEQRLGLTVTDLPREIAQQTDIRFGALITEVRPGSPAGQADLQPGMVVVELGGARIDNARALARALEKGRSGATLLLRLRVPGSDARILRALTLP